MGSCSSCSDDTDFATSHEGRIIAKMDRLDHAEAASPHDAASVGSVGLVRAGNAPSAGIGAAAAVAAASSSAGAAAAGHATTTSSSRVLATRRSLPSSPAVVVVTYAAGNHQQPQSGSAPSTPGVGVVANTTTSAGANGGANPQSGAGAGGGRMHSINTSNFCVDVESEYADSCGNTPRSTSSGAGGWGGATFDSSRTSTSASPGAHHQTIHQHEIRDFNSSRGSPQNMALSNSGTQPASGVGWTAVHHHSASAGSHQNHHPYQSATLHHDGSHHGHHGHNHGHVNHSHSPYHAYHAATGGGGGGGGSAPQSPFPPLPSPMSVRSESHSVVFDPAMHDSAAASHWDDTLGGGGGGPNHAFVLQGGLRRTGTRHKITAVEAAAAARRLSQPTTPLEATPPHAVVSDDTDHSHVRSWVANQTAFVATAPE